MENKQPEIRFPGCTDDWEQHKLGEISHNNFGGGTPKTNIPEYWEGSIPWIQSSDLITDRLFDVIPRKKITDAAVKKSATKLVPANSIAIVTRVGVGKLAFMPYSYTTSQDFLSLSNLIINSNFSVYSIYKMLQRELNNIQGTSIKGITKPDLLDKTIFVPPSSKEQQKIGSFFKQLDETITHHQQELATLKQTKQGFLQKMFPKEGAKVPEVRFPGFTDDWEQRKLADILINLESGVSVNSSDTDTGYFILKTSAIKHGRVDLTEVKSIVPAELGRAKTPTIKNSIIISRMNTPELVGASGLVTETNANIFLPDRLWQGMVNAQFSSEWLIQSINTEYSIKRIRDLATGTSGSMKNISKKAMLDFNINVPKLNEQKKIGNFFKQLDDTITLHQRELELLQATKKAFLQKLFV